MKKTMPHLPQAPGVYLFKNSDEGILYIGKAQSLKNRISSYFSNYKKDWKVTALIDEHESIEHIITPTTHDALVIEAKLIQEYQPKYNRLLKDGNPFVYIQLTKGLLPSFKIVRTNKGPGVFFGPFIHKYAARGALRFLNNTFGLNTCSTKIENGCLKYHLGICAGTCRNSFDKEAYQMRISLALAVLRNEQHTFKKTIETEIKQANKSLNFEKAKQLHHYLENVDYIFTTIKNKSSQEILAPHLAEAQAHKKIMLRRDPSLAIGLQDLLQTTHPIKTIDCFDISHFQSRNIVGACVRFTDGIPDKNKFRRFKVKHLSQQNDYAALQEIVMRRYSNDDLPDLILIDGGVGQFNCIQSILPHVTLASLAKKEEKLFTPSHPQGHHLNLHNPSEKTLISLRDYTHHFAISYHRLLQKKQLHR